MSWLKSLRSYLGGDGDIVHKEAIKGELKRSCLSNEKLRKAGWEPKHAFSEGLRDTVVSFE